MMTVLGIDPGYDRVGWALIELSDTRRASTSLYGCIQTSKSASLIARYQQITSELDEILKKVNPSEIAIEQIFFSKNQKTAIRVSEARGVILATVLPHQIPISEYTPNQIKLAVTGFGNADKQAVEKMVRMQLKLPAGKVIDDTIDALAIAFTHSFLRFKAL